MTEKTLIIVVGAKASGKTTFTKNITSNERCMKAEIYTDKCVKNVNKHLISNFKKGTIIKNLVIECHNSNFSELMTCLQYNQLFYERVIIEVVTDNENEELPVFMTDRKVSIIKPFLTT